MKNNQNNINDIWLVIPCYNEQEVILETSRQLKEIMKSLIEREKISTYSRIAFVDDGSKDNTWELIEGLFNEDELFVGIKLSRNQGHQNALLAGLMTAREYADAVISLDADLQDDISVIEKFIDEFNNGNDVVYGVRSARDTDTLFKRKTAEFFYKVMGKLGVEIVYNHADYRLMSKCALDALSDYKEVNIFLRGIVPQIGYKTSIVKYERHERFAGESKYPLKKMLSFAVEGITSFSIKPIRIVTNAGILAFTVSILMLVYSIIQHMVGNTVSGWTSIVVSIWALGGLQLIGLGIIGEYVGKVYLEAKNRPKYIIEKVIKNIKKQ